MKPICFLFLSVTRINPCLKQQRYQKKLQVTHSTGHVKSENMKIWIKWNSENMNFIQFCAARTLPSRLQHHYISYSFALSNDIFFLHLGFPRQKGNHTLLWNRHRTPLQIVLRAVKSKASWILVNKNLS